MFDLSGKVVVVTGAGSGIGRGIAAQVARAGARAVLVGRRPAPLAEAVEAIVADGGSAVFRPADIADKDSLDGLVEFLAAETDRLDGWVNNAGGAEHRHRGALLDISESDFDAIMALNLRGTFLAARAAAKAMRHGGSIVNLSSRTAHTPSPGFGHYSAAKAAVESLTLTMAYEWGRHGIRVNAVAPGLVITERNNAVYQDSAADARAAAAAPMGRFGVPGDIGAVCAFLLSDEASWVSGAVIPVNGGSPIPINMTPAWPARAPGASG